MINSIAKDPKFYMMMGLSTMAIANLVDQKGDVGMKISLWIALTFLFISIALFIKDKVKK